MMLCPCKYSLDNWPKFTDPNNIILNRKCHGFFSTVFINFHERVVRNITMQLLSNLAIGQNYLQSVLGIDS